MENTVASTKLTVKTKDLSDKRQKISFLKDILNIEKETATEVELQKELEFTVRNNFAYLVVINSMLKEMPQSIKNKFIELCEFYLDELLYLRKRKKIKELFENNGTFQLYENFVIQVLVKDILKASKKNSSINDDAFKQQYLQEKKIYQCLIYEIAIDFISPRVSFDTTNIVMNFHFLLKWLQDNEGTSKAELTNDECEILAGLIYGLTSTGMFKLNLSSFVQTELDIEKIIYNLPQKFKLKNITQVIFKIFNLAPHIWCLKEHVQVIKTIKGL